VPEVLELDTFEGRCWLGVTPFRLDAFRLRGLPPAPYASDFLEVNVRTYVVHEEKPGIWFFSLDATSRLAVWAARRTFYLPYHHADISVATGETIDFRCERNQENRLALTYRPAGSAITARPGSLEHFLTERYCQYSSDGESLYRTEIHHPPWQLQRAEVKLSENSLVPPGLSLVGEPLLHYSQRQDALIWRPETSS
jgi:uncharacterized protein YqjF (DUF2071 family)